MLLTEESLVWSIWFIDKIKGMDWMGFLVRQEPGKPWEFVYRFRYYVDNKAHDSNDKKSWHGVQAGPADCGDQPPPQMITAAQTIANTICAKYKGELHTLHVRGNGMKAMEALQSQSWCHIRAEEAEKLS